MCKRHNIEKKLSKIRYAQMSNNNLFKYTGNNKKEYALQIWYKVEYFMLKIFLRKTRIKKIRKPRKDNSCEFKKKAKVNS